MEKVKLLELMQNRLAEISVSGSALRNQRGAGVVSTARDFLKKINLAEFGKNIISTKNYPDYLNNQTEQLVKDFESKKIVNWGAARKSLNLFFREVVYNKFLAENLCLPTEFEAFNRAIQVLEIPLDNDVATSILEVGKRLGITALPKKWPRIVHLDETASADFQAAASKIAIHKKTVRIHLDLVFWRNQDKISEK